ncbi:MAG TPA: M23 family metallopeptidase [Stellaceae bacterium]|jgi:murein DD-endopeptidase MepM/ murein hydrolase activator NlpD|nr:M23 family metallopeptidase [Stellaceae bacterium]
MGDRIFEWRGFARVAAAIILASLTAACVTSSSEPAPVELRGGGPGISGDAMAPLPSMPAPRAEARRIVVRPGQSLGGIAHAYHVPARAIIAANHLRPPYKVEIGQRLLIPGGAMLAGAGPVGRSGITATPLGAPAPPISEGHPPPDIIPLDGPAPPATPAAALSQPSRAPVPLIPPSSSPNAPRSGAEPSAAEEARADAAASAQAARPASPQPNERAAEKALPHGGHFPWPVRGHVLAGYGVAAGGAHNDGINIAAPKGAPISAVDGGVVAYAGNELKGYGNLVLIKHPDGWISAYAHCEDLLVKRGEKVSRGQIIAKVGATGGVSEPQLHFELRRGQRAVDPREFLTPAPSAWLPTTSHQG